LTEKDNKSTIREGISTEASFPTIMKILVTNDDGIDSPGIWALADALRKVSTVVVSAPHQEQSGAGSSIHLRQPIQVNEVKSRLSGVTAYSIKGTPVDSVIIATKFLFDDGIDLVVAGINNGPNIGNDVFVSGTVNAAFQGYLRGISSLAVSVAAYDNPHLEPAAKIATQLAISIKNGELPPGIFLNVNSPDLPLEKIRGIEITKLSNQSCCENIVHDDPDGNQNSKVAFYRILRNKNSWQKNPGSDVWALEQNNFSLTLLPDNCEIDSLRSCLECMVPAIYDRLRKQ
jgi:5'-nucleotidase